MLLNVIPFVHDLLAKTVTKNDITIDATCGNGHDTLFLCNLSSFVYGFDIQEDAIESTKQLLKNHTVSNYSLIQDSHEYLFKYVKQKVKAVTFNLGYLPGSDKTIQTNATSTIEAIRSCIDLLDSNGMICITLYIGHEGGSDEAKQVEQFALHLNKRDFKVAKYSFINRNAAPYVIVIEKQ